MKRFVHNANIEHFRRLIAESEFDLSRDEDRHKMLLTLLAPHRFSVMRPEPSEDVRPDARISLPSYQNSEVLQCNADLAWVFDERDVVGRQRIKERFN